jgi:nucleoside-diphosphate-sugar epimerase
MKIAVTGATGFVGGKLIHFLADRGHAVTALARSEDKIEMAKTLAGDRKITWCLSDVTDRPSLEAAFRGIETVIHLAALFNHPECSWDDYQRVNVEGTRNVFKAARDNGIKRIVHCSTIGVASAGQLPFSEATPYAPPIWDKYETTKCDAEKIAVDFMKDQNPEVVVIRPAQIYGPGDRNKAKFYRMVKKGVIVNPGKTMKHLIYIDDLCRAFALAAVEKKANGEIVIIGGKAPILLAELIKVVAKELNVAAPKIILPAWFMTLLCAVTESICNLIRIKPILFRRSMDFFRKTVAFDISKASRVLGFESEVSVEKGVQATADWYRQNRLI